MGVGMAYAAEGDAPAELIIPADGTADPYAWAVRPGATGFLQGGRNGDYAWYSYADGTSVPFDDAGAVLFATDTDTIARWYGSQSKVVLQDGGGGAQETIALGADRAVIGMAGRTVIAVGGTSSSTLHVVALDNGSAVERTVTGLPAGATNIKISARTAYGFLASYEVGGARAFGWVDLAGAALKPLPELADRKTAVRHGDVLLHVTSAGKLRVWDLKGDWSAPLRETDWSGTDTPVALHGDRVLSVTAATADGTRTLLSRAFAGGEQKAVLDGLVEAPLAAASDLLVTQKTDNTDRPVYRVAAGADGEFAATKIATIMGEIAQPMRISAAQGVLHTVDHMPSGEYRLRSIETKAGGPLVAGDRVDRGTDTRFDTSWEVPTGDGRVVRKTGPELSVLTEGASVPGTSLAAGSVAGDLEASGRYASYRLTSGERRVFDLDARKAVFTRNLGTGPTALNGSTLWTTTGTAGAVAAIDVRTGATTRTVTAADCVIKDVQSVGADLYWKCDAKAGVLNTGTNVHTALPGHSQALLGDGFVTHEKDELLYVTPLRGGGQTREIGRPADGMRETGWNVDRFGGHTVFTDNVGRIHVVPSGVPASPVSVVDSTVSSDILDVEGGDAWSGQWWLSRPVASWTLTFKNPAGEVVRTFDGHQTRGAVKAAWDGNGANGAPVADGRYTWELTAPPADGVGETLRTGGTVFVTRGRVSTFKPVPPARILNTLAGVGAPKAKVGQGGTVDLQVTGRGGVAASGVSAVVLTVTVTNPSNSTWLAVYPYGTPRPMISNLNVPAGRSVPNQVTVPVGKDGKISLYNAWGTADLLVDVTGYYTLDGAGDRFKAVTPARILNTLAGVGAPKAKVGAGKTVNLQIAGRGGVPSTGVTAVVMNVTATNVTASSYVSVFPYGTARPATSNLNVVKGQVVANLVTVPVKSGKVTLYNHGGTVDLLGDVAGYFTNTAGQGDRFVPLNPVRLLDTRDYGVDGKLGPDSAATLGVAGYGGIPETGANSLVLNLAGTNATSATYVAIHPWLTERPTISNLNLVPRLTVANQVVVPMSSEGGFDLYNRAGYVDLIVDAAGYYTK
ncbi:FlgD immunoglobulin-like domain containing protein [Streptomyces sp. NPDC012769]|uniref:FlgD immunoglobulin-like domain containing protein n=1 Tax=Streptomyces sp. NPDC012769 TaxID=3364848 RepID=UPI00367E9739